MQAPHRLKPAALRPILAGVSPPSTPSGVLADGEGADSGLVHLANHDVAQGYCFRRPMTGASMSRLLEAGLMQERREGQTSMASARDSSNASESSSKMISRPSARDPRRRRGSWMIESADFSGDTSRPDFIPK